MLSEPPHKHIKVMFSSLVAGNGTAPRSTPFRSSHARAPGIGRPLDPIAVMMFAGAPERPGGLTAHDVDAKGA